MAEIRKMAPLKSRLTALTRSSFLRFFGASLFGFVFDIALASALHQFLDIPLVLAAASSLLTASVLMYFIHEFWTFHSSVASLSFARMLGTTMSAVAALAVRSASLYSIGDILGLGDRFAILQLGVASGLSFVLNYLLVRRIIGLRHGANSH